MVAAIANFYARDRRRISRSSRAVSGQIVQLGAALPPPVPGDLAHFLERCSCLKRQAWIEATDTDRSRHRCVVSLRPRVPLENFCSIGRIEPNQPLKSRPKYIWIPMNRAVNFYAKVFGGTELKQNWQFFSPEG